MKIGEMAAMAGLTTKTLRFYEERGLLPTPTRTPSGYRDYPPEALNRLDFIRRGRNAGLTLAQLSEILDLRDAGQAPCHHVEDLLRHRLAHLDRQIADLQELRTTVAGLHEAAAGADPQACDATEICRYL
ncbi:MAG TPA: heavy metal-responsive transcriptional regulator [Acidimicrobiales bacterium]|nr:heavy metal-responsive transcriptional regulator [Acidimicrobiales bacterium]